MVGSAPGVGREPSFDEIVGLLSDDFKRLVTILSIKHSMSSLNISRLIGTYETKVALGRKSALKELKELSHRFPFFLVKIKD